DESQNARADGRRTSPDPPAQRVRAAVRTGEPCGQNALPLAAHRGHLGLRFRRQRTDSRRAYQSPPRPVSGGPAFLPDPDDPRARLSDGGAVMKRPLTAGYAWRLAIAIAVVTMALTAAFYLSAFVYERIGVHPHPLVALIVNGLLGIFVLIAAGAVMR